MCEFQEKMSENLQCGIDWLSFTLLDVAGVIEALGMFGFDYSDFYFCDTGAFGYKHMLLLNGSSLRVLYDGNTNMGVHFDISGSSVPDLLEAYRNVCSEETPFNTKAVDWDFQIIPSLFQKILDHGQITRLDLAIDNKHDIYFRVPELQRILLAGRFVSKFRSWRNVTDYRVSSGVSGNTLYLGSRSSAVMLRVYDKQLEQNTKLEAAGKTTIEHEWVRWELELKDERARVAAEYFVAGLSIGQVCFGILENYFRIINFDNSNKSRCSNDIKWAEFINGVQALRLYVAHAIKTLDDKMQWIMLQVAPTLVALIIARYGDVSFLINNIEVTAGRMKRQLRDLVSAANPGWEECLAALAG